MYKNLIFQDKLIKMKDEKCRMLIEIQNIRKQNQELVLPLKIAQKCVEELQHKAIINQKAHKANEVSWFHKRKTELIHKS